MELLKNWASELLFASMGCMLVSMLFVHNRLKSALQVMTALLFMCSVLGPLASVFSLLQDGVVVEHMDSSPPSVLTKTVDEQSLALIEQVLLADARELLKEENVTVTAVHVSTEDETSSLTVDRVRAVFRKGDKPISESVVRQLSSAWGIPVEVYYSDGD